jgi:hypothetical protein
MIAHVVHCGAVVSVAFMYATPSVSLFLPVISYSAITTHSSDQYTQAVKFALFVASSAVVLWNNPGVSVVPHMLTGISTCIHTGDD